MDVFIVNMENRPGMLAGLTESLAGRGVNITAVAAATSTDSGSVALTTDDEAGTRAALDAAGVDYRVTGAATASLEHRPGTLAAAARRLADAGVNVEAVFATGMEGGRVTIAFAVEDPAAAQAALGEG